MKEDVKKYGIYNSELVGQMPTASTSQIMSNNESFEPFTSNFYKRKTLVGDFNIMNRHLVKELEAIGMWTMKIRNALIAEKGSIQNIVEIPEHLRKIFKTYFEINSQTLVKIVAAFSCFVTQSVSFNRYYKNPTIDQIKADDFLCYLLGLKTISYYTKVNSAENAQNFDSSSTTQLQNKKTITNAEDKSPSSTPSLEKTTRNISSSSSSGSGDSSSDSEERKSGVEVCFFNIKVFFSIRLIK